MAYSKYNTARFQRDIPVKEGEIYDVEIEGVGEKGDGIGKVKGYVVIVPNTQKGDNVKVRVTAVRGRVSFGEVVGDGETPAKSADAGSEEGAETADAAEAEDTEAEEAPVEEEEAAEEKEAVAEEEETGSEDEKSEGEDEVKEEGKKKDKKEAKVKGKKKK